MKVDRRWNTRVPKVLQCKEAVPWHARTQAVGTDLNPNAFVRELIRRLSDTAKNPAILREEIATKTMNACVMATVATAVLQKVLLLLYLIVTWLHIHTYRYCGVLIIRSLQRDSRGYFVPQRKCLIGRRATTWHCQIQNGGNTSIVCLFQWKEG